jgi:hypothetical protein
VQRFELGGFLGLGFHGGGLPVSCGTAVSVFPVSLAELEPGALWNVASLQPALVGFHGFEHDCAIVRKRRFDCGFIAPAAGRQLPFGRLFCQCRRH